MKTLLAPIVMVPLFVSGCSMPEPDEARQIQDVLQFLPPGSSNVRMLHYSTARGYYASYVFEGKKRHFRMNSNGTNKSYFE